MAARIVLQIRQYKKLAEEKGWHSDKAAALAIGVDPTTVWRVRKGLKAPSQAFIAGLLEAAKPWDFYDLFTVEPDTTTRGQDAA